MRCEEFLSRLEDPDLQEGGPWPQEILLHARRCGRCAEILAIFQAIPSEVARLPRSSGDDEEPAAVLLTIHEGIPQVIPNRIGARRAGARWALAAAAALALVVVPWQGSRTPETPAAATPRAPALVQASTPGGPLVDALADAALVVDEAAGVDEAAVVQPAAAAPARPVRHTARPAHPSTASRPAAREASENGGSTSAASESDRVADAALVMPASPLPGVGSAPSSPVATRAVPREDTTADISPSRGGDAALAVARRATRGRVAETPRVRIGQGVVVMSDVWGTGAGYGGEIGIQQRFWFDPHMGLSLDGGVRYGVAPGFDALPDDKPRAATGGTVAGTGSVMFAVRARPALVGVGVGFSAGEWDPGPDACSDLRRAVPERNVACDEWTYISPDLVASMEFDVSRDVRLGVRWSGHDQGYELGRDGEVATAGAWINRVTLEASFRPGAAGSGPVLAKARRLRDDDSSGDSETRTAIAPR